MSIVDNARDLMTRIIETGAAAGYLVRNLLFGAPESTSYTPPWTPPFTGGQCPIYYSVFVSFFINNTDGGGVRWTGEVNIGEFVGAITSVRQAGLGGSYYITAGGVESIWYDFRAPFTSDVKIVRVAPSRGDIDNCGNLGSPYPPLPTPESGLANGAYPTVGGSDSKNLVINGGTALVPIGTAFTSALSALIAAVNAAKAAAALLDAIKSVADAIKAIADLMDKIKDILENKDKKDKKKNVRIIQYDFGSINSDGFLRLYPSGSTNLKGIYLDIQALSIPSSYGKYFGSRSPNRYRFKELGYIAFVSPTFGIMEVRSIEFRRVSFAIPSGSVGFFYHLGLDGAVSANATGFYEEELPAT